MKYKFLKSIIVGTFGALNLAIFPLIVRAEKTQIKVSCNKNLSTEISVPTDNYHRDYRDKYYLRFGEIFANDPYRAKQLCEDVAQKLQSYGDGLRKLKIYQGEQNDRVIFCLTPEEENSCTTSSEVLFVLEPGESEEILNGLLAEKISPIRPDRNGLSTFPTFDHLNFLQRTIQRLPF
ncbi:COP23 domain-containing protein [Dapis sp. BLCC M126]|uniref:COP23 domain-containing protein n=1 Tax=Dapis sp. BLCC M126 TaxID=3400189 RepID=UPI003CF59FBB